MPKMVKSDLASNAAAMPNGSPQSTTHALYMSSPLSATGLLSTSSWILSAISVALDFWSLLNFWLVTHALTSFTFADVGAVLCSKGSWPSFLFHLFVCTGCTAGLGTCWTGWTSCSGGTLLAFSSSAILLSNFSCSR